MFSILPAKVAQREGNTVRQLSKAKKEHELGISYVALLECQPDARPTSKQPQAGGLRRRRRSPRRSPRS